MQSALEEAQKAFEKGEIPVGAALVHEDTIIARNHNRNRAEHNPVKHAEILVIEEASDILGNERLTGCELYVTKEPCAMCAGAIVHARIARLIIGTPDAKYGACGSALSVCGNEKLNHIPVIEFGVLQEESAKLLSEFFKRLRLGNV